MGGSVSLNNPVITAAFHDALRNQEVFVFVLLLIALLAWSSRHLLTPVTAPDNGSERQSDARPSTGGEPRGRLVLRCGFGALWVLDGLLQVQQSMPVGLPSSVIDPATAGAPSWVHSLVGDGVSIWTRHPIPASTSAVWIQLGLGVLLLLAPRGRLSRTAGVLSIGWGMSIWIFAEAFGGLFTPGMSWLFGGPGAALFYCLAGVLVAMPEHDWRSGRVGRLLRFGLGAFFLVMAGLQGWPGRGFWQGTAGGSRVGIASMLTTMAGTPQPGFLSSAIGDLASLVSRHGAAANFFVVASLFAIGAGLLARRRGPRRVATSYGVLLCLAVWVFVQDLGFLGGVGTDPNSMIPIAFLLVTADLAGRHAPAPLDAREAPALAVPAPTSGRLRPAFARGALGVTAGLAALGVMLVGAVPMAFASADPHTDAIVTEAINGQPERTNSPAPSFALIDESGRPVSTASLRGRTIALTFLDPVCTSDCPLIAQQFRDVDAGLGSRGQASTAFVAVAANPTYRSAAFLRAFDSQEGLSDVHNWYFLTGTLAQLTRVWNEYGIQVQVESSGAMVAHNDMAFVIDARGRLRSIFGADMGDGGDALTSFATLLDSEIRAAMHR